MSQKIESVMVASLVVLLVLGGAWIVSADEGTAASAGLCSRELPEAVAAPAGHELAFELLAEGVQVYACARPDGAAAPAWTFRAPEATLIERRGVYAGRHGAGPIWEALDGSSVGAAKVSGATPDPAAIPWLLLRATSHGAAGGRMAGVTFVQRVRTSGGVAPTEGCSEATLGSVARVPYSAVYCFLRGRAE